MLAIKVESCVSVSQTIIILSRAILIAPTIKSFCCSEERRREKMACPMGYGVRFQGGAEVFEAEENDVTQAGTNKATSGKGVSYRDYLQVCHNFSRNFICSFLVRQIAECSNFTLRGCWKAVGAGRACK